jgi:hypothetical protein
MFVDHAASVDVVDAGYPFFHRSAVVSKAEEAEEVKQRGFKSCVAFFQP